jgi:hypothetical protein
MTREMIMKIRFGFCGDQTSKQQWFLTYDIKHHKVMNFIVPVSHSQTPSTPQRTLVRETTFLVTAVVNRLSRS